MLVKRTLTFTDDVGVEAGQQIDPPLRKVAAVAVIDNPFAGRFERDLGALTEASAEIGRRICRIAIALLSSAVPATLRQARRQRLAIERAQERGAGSRRSRRLHRPGTHRWRRR